VRRLLALGRPVLQRQTRHQNRRLLALDFWFRGLCTRRRRGLQQGEHCALSGLYRQTISWYHWLKLLRISSAFDLILVISVAGLTNHESSQMHPIQKECSKTHTQPPGRNYQRVQRNLGRSLDNRYRRNSFRNLQETKTTMTKRPHSNRVNSNLSATP